MELEFDRQAGATSIVESEAIRLRSSGSAPIILGAILFFGGLILQQPLVLVVGMVVFLGAAALRRVETRRALETMPLARGAEVRAEVERTAVAVNVLRSIVSIVFLHVMFAVCFWLGTR